MDTHPRSLDIRGIENIGAHQITGDKNRGEGASSIPPPLQLLHICCRRNEVSVFKILIFQIKLIKILGWKKIMLICFKETNPVFFPLTHSRVRKTFDQRNWVFTTNSDFLFSIFFQPVSEFNGFESRLESHKKRFQLSAGLNLERI